MQDACNRVKLQATTLSRGQLAVYAQSQAVALILNRLMILKEFCSKYISDEKFPYYWLLLQVKPLLTDNLILNCSRIFSKCDSREMVPLVQELLNWLKSKTGLNLFNFMDEAQILLEILSGQFDGPTHLTKDHSILTPFLQACAQFTALSTFVSGTGLALRQSVTVITSAYGKPDADMSKRLIVNFGGYNDILSMRDYILQFINVDDEIMRSLFGFLRGILEFICIF
jgi:hypothetical protein